MVSRYESAAMTPPAGVMSHDGVMSRTAPSLRFRHSPASATAAALMVLVGLSVGGWAPYLLVLLAVPALLAVWAWRAGTDVDSDGITVRAAFAGRRVGWSDVTGFVTDDKGRVVATVAAGSAIVLTAVRPADLPSLVAASGHDLVTT
jgi:D-serine deaminase-like pyridoxal phosphate-dependent protein